MTPIEVSPLSTSRERRVFLTFPWRIYRDDPLWVPPLLPERAKTIDPQRGPFFQRGEAEFFIAWRDGEPVGTICAAEDKPANEFRHRQECLFGFFECVQDYDVATAMLRQVMEWAEQRGLNVLFGPFNLDYEDSYGVLVEGRDRPPTLLCGHTPPYYQSFLERFGFQPARGDNLAYAKTLEGDTPAMRRLFRLADRVRERRRITIRSADLEHWREEIARVHRLLNVALAHLPDHAPWRREALEDLLEPFRHIVDPDLPPARVPGDQERPGKTRVLEHRRQRAALRRDGRARPGQGLSMARSVAHVGGQPQYPYPGPAHGSQALQTVSRLSPVDVSSDFPEKRCSKARPRAGASPGDGFGSLFSVE